MLADRYGLALSTGSAVARDAYVQACDLALTLYPGAVGAYDRAIAHDPGFALAHAGKAQVLMREGNVVAARSALAAAKQAALLGVRGIAISTFVSENKEPDFNKLEPYVAKVLDLLLEEKTMSLVNVNLPEKPRGIRWTRQSVRQYDGKVVPGKDPMGRPIYWFTVTPLEGADEGTDRWAVEHNWVSITPLRLDLTAEKDLARALALPHAPPIIATNKRQVTTRSRKKPHKRRLGVE